MASKEIRDLKRQLAEAQERAAEWEDRYIAERETSAQLTQRIKNLTRSAPDRAGPWLSRPPPVESEAPDEERLDLNDSDDWEHTP